MVPTVQRDRNYDLADLPTLMKLLPDPKSTNVAVIGAGAVCEMMTSLNEINIKLLFFMLGAVAVCWNQLRDDG